MVRVGVKRFASSKLETRILVENGATLTFGGYNSIGYGSDIEVFKKSNLTIGVNSSTNIGATIICGDNILYSG